MSVRVSILTISDRSSRGEREDLSGPALKSQVNDQGWEVVHKSVVPDDLETIKETLSSWADTCGSAEGPRPLQHNPTHPTPRPVHGRGVFVLTWARSGNRRISVSDTEICMFHSGDASWGHTITDSCNIFMWIYL